MSELPEYYDYFRDPLKIVRAPGGGVRAYRLNDRTGRFEIANAALSRIRSARSSDDIFGCDEEEFVKLAEENRAMILRGEGPIFALYKIIDDMYAMNAAFDDPTWAVLRRAIRDIRHRTFQLWEEEFTRRDAGEPPTFHFEHPAGPASRPDPRPPAREMALT